MNEKNGVSKRYSSPFKEDSAKDKLHYDGTFEDYLITNDLIELFEQYTQRFKHPTTGVVAHKIDQFRSY